MPGILVPDKSQLALYDGTRLGDDGVRGYVKHLDNVGIVGEEGENFREITAIVYLNEFEGKEGKDGKEGEEGKEGEGGGELRCYGHTHELTVDVRPKRGRMVVFKSRELYHEVMEVRGWKRLAMSVWCLKDSRDEM